MVLILKILCILSDYNTLPKAANLRVLRASVVKNLQYPLHHNKPLCVHIHDIGAVGQVRFRVPEFKGIAFRQAFQLGDHVGSQDIGFALQRNGIAVFGDVQGELKNLRAFCAAVDAYLGMAGNFFPADVTAEFSGKQQIRATIRRLSNGLRARRRVCGWNSHPSEETRRE